MNLFHWQLGRPRIKFLDHAWGHVSPNAAISALARFFALDQLGNFSWDVIFGEIIPEAATNVMGMLGVDEMDSFVEFGHNSHELVSRIISSRFEYLLADEVGSSAPEARRIRILTSDTEFYSFTRQTMRFAEASSRFVVDCIEAEPAESFVQRCVASFCLQKKKTWEQVCCQGASRFLSLRYPVCFSSHLQIPTVHHSEHCGIRVCGQRRTKRRRDCTRYCGRIPRIRSHPHCSSAWRKCHLRCGCLETRWRRTQRRVRRCSSTLEPATSVDWVRFLPSSFFVDLIGLPRWLADSSVLHPSSSGLKFSDAGAIRYDEGSALMGATPAFAVALLTFNCVVARWLEGCRVASAAGNSESRQSFAAVAHSRVMRLHDRFLSKLKSCSHPAVNLDTLIGPQDSPIRSHTLVFRQESAAQAHEVVQALAAKGIAVDNRGEFLRIGFGFNHSVEEVDFLIAALQPRL